MAVKMVEEIKCLKDISVEGHAQANPGTSYYASIVGPRFMGKTQTAFTLSHKINVIYVNLLAAASEENDLSVQLIYAYFRQFSTLFFETIDKDMIAWKEFKLGPNLNNFREGFYTLGLLYLLIRSYAIKSEQSVEDRFLERINMQTASIPALNVCEFKERLNGNFTINYSLLL